MIQGSVMSFKSIARYALVPVFKEMKRRPPFPSFVHLLSNEEPGRVQVEVTPSRRPFRSWSGPGYERGA